MITKWVELSKLGWFIKYLIFFFVQKHSNLFNRFQIIVRLSLILTLMKLGRCTFGQHKFILK